METRISTPRACETDRHNGLSSIAAGAAPPLEHIREERGDRDPHENIEDHEQDAEDVQRPPAAILGLLHGVMLRPPADGRRAARATQVDRLPMVVRRCAGSRQAELLRQHEERMTKHCQPTELYRGTHRQDQAMLDTTPSARARLGLGPLILLSLVIWALIASAVLELFE